MRLKKLLKDYVDFIKNPENDFNERVYLLLTFVSEISVFCGLVGDIVTGEDIKEILVIIATLFAVPIVSLVTLYKKKVHFAIRFIATSLVFVILPALFFFGGGVEGGGVLWFVFAFLYVGLVMSGRGRTLMFAAIFFLCLACYLIQYNYPSLVVEHSRSMFFTDSFISVILIGIVGFYMTWSQNQLFTAENERARKETERAEELTRAQNRFFSSMSHEIRTPINSILGLNELILRDDTASEEVIKDATGIQGSGKMLLALINDILDFSKMEAGSMDLVPVDYQVGNMISEIVNMIWLKAHDKGLSFNVSIDPKVPTVLYGDEVRIKQVIVNLLNNAVKYTAEGAIELHIESENKSEKLTSLSISVTDTGMGIKKEALPDLFDAFKRVDEEKNRYIEGTGLGLSIVKQIVELMGGNISVNSVYGEGSTFTVTVDQGITDISQIGELSIHNQLTVKRNRYESSFKAHDAKILIVDDNEMNLEVEKKLLSETGLEIDTALSGRDALKLAIETQYDVILMDHLMPEMDGIECLKAVREQSGGLNRTTPVIVLTANAGSDNRELYTRSGFDGYLVKPVSGEALEETLTKYISRDKLIISSKMLRMKEDINTTAGYARKADVIITSTSMCDLPDTIIKKLGIPILPFLIRTDEGVFKDGVQMDSDELIRYILDGGNAVSSPPTVKEYTDFFANALKKAHQLIHISITSGMSDDYDIALEAAKSFDNVIIINSESLSSATGILVLIAERLASQGVHVDDIVRELNEIKHRLRCSFVIDTTEHMAKKGLINQRLNRLAKALSIHPALCFKDDKAGIGGAWIGNKKRIYKKYIHKAFPVDIIPDQEVVFITYADIPYDTLLWIKEEVSKNAYFEHVVFQQASAAISSNCGPGSLGIIYFVKSNKNYNISALVEEVKDINDSFDEALEDHVELHEDQLPDNTEDEIAEDITVEEKELPWYKQIDCIDGDIAITNSGSEDEFKTVLKIFYDSASDKTAELSGFFNAADWGNYTIKIHALKSSAKLIGAMELAEKAQLLENAGKENNIDYIKENYELFMSDYNALIDELSGLFVSTESEASDNRPVADEFMMESVYEGLREAAENMDCDMIGEILSELSEYAIPESEKEKYDAITEKAGKYDYDGILELLG